MTPDARGHGPPGVVRPEYVAVIRGVVAPIVRAMHRPTLEGTENLPPKGPYLLVANHSAGVGLSEIACIASLYLEKVGPDRPLAGFAHPIAFRFGVVAKWMRDLGAVPSTYADGEAVLASGTPLLVFPGGDHETFRPVWQHGRVDFGGRRGFLKMAKKANVPIVPLGIQGSHFTAPVLWRSRHLLPNLFVLPRLVGLKRWAVTAFGAVGAAALLSRPWPLWLRGLSTWAWLTSPLVFLPVVPATIRMRIGTPILPEDLFAGGDVDLAMALARVEGEVQRIVTSLA